jgi:NAD(P)-dependent dehydrogenase (short-subunit alcohol dehydrogenase family)
MIRFPMHNSSMRILMTGASGALGGVMACAFLGAGHRVAGVARSWKGVENSGGFYGVAASLETREDALKIVAEAEGLLGGPIEGLVHVLGGFAGGMPVEDTDVATMSRMMALNYEALYHSCAAVLPGMKAAGVGRIVVIGARATQTTPATLSAYTASKAAAVALVKTLAAETRGMGIAANVIAPGTMDTAANRAAMPDVDPAQWIPPQHVASLAVWLCSPAGASVSGQEWIVSGRE